MPWWSWRPGHAAGVDPETRSVRTADRLGVPVQREPEHVCSDHEVSMVERPATACSAGEPVTLNRLGNALDLLDVRYLADGGGSLLAMWERHAVLFTLEGPDDEILVIRARPHSTVPPDWADRAYRVVNEWNHTRRFCKAYVGDPPSAASCPSTPRCRCRSRPAPTTPAGRDARLRRRRSQQLRRLAPRRGRAALEAEALYRRTSVGRATVCSRAHRARPRGLALPGPPSHNLAPAQLSARLRGTATGPRSAAARGPRRPTVRAGVWTRAWQGRPARAEPLRAGATVVPSTDPGP